MFKLPWQYVALPLLMTSFDIPYDFPGSQTDREVGEYNNLRCWPSECRAIIYHHALTSTSRLVQTLEEIKAGLDMHRSRHFNVSRTAAHT